MAINLETVKFIDFLNSLARGSEKGIRPFSKATRAELDEDYLIYDDRKPVFSIGDANYYYLTSFCMIAGGEREILAIYDKETLWDGVDVKAVVGVDKETWLEVIFEDDPGTSIIIESGQWSFV